MLSSRMKKTFLLILATFMTATINATILRVSNVTGSSAPYTSIADAHDAATDGDTIFVEGSAETYTVFTITISKSIVLIGPGYNMKENGVANENIQPASMSNLEINAEGVSVHGITVTNNIDISKNNVVVNRCKINNVRIDSEATGTVLHQNYIIDGVLGNDAKNVSISNNIFANTEPLAIPVKKLQNSYFGYNTCMRKKGNDKFPFLDGFSGCTVENNIFGEEFDEKSSNKVVNNYVFTETPYQDTSSEVKIKEAELSFSEGKYGAFGGDTPYVISGIPAGPVIEDVTIPASVEKGKKLNVTIKLGIQK